MEHYIRNMKKVEFNHELSEKAFAVYASSEYCFYKDNDGCFYVTSGQNESHGIKLGNTVSDVEDFLLEDDL